jgi:hypothetical protein
MLASCFQMHNKLVVNLLQQQELQSYVHCHASLVAAAVLLFVLHVRFLCHCWCKQRLDYTHTTPCDMYCNALYLAQNESAVSQQACQPQCLMLLLAAPCLC